MNSSSRRLCLLTSIILVLILSACGSTNTGTNTGSGTGTPTVTHLSIMVGGLSKQIYLPNELTKQLGYFTQQGLDVTLIDEASGQSSVDQVLAGQVDAGSGSYNHTIELQAAGKQIECVVQLDIAPGEAEMVSAKEAGQVHSFADLKGKNLGVTELGSGTHTLSIALLHKAGLRPDQAHFVPVGAGDTFIAAMQQGKIDAGMIICVFMKNDYVNSHKDVVQKLVNAYVKTLQWIHTHTADQIAAMMPPDYYANNKDLYVTALQNQLSIFSPDGNMPSDGPGSVLSIEQQTNQAVQGKQIDLSTTFTNEFTSKATG